MEVKELTKKEFLSTWHNSKKEYLVGYQGHCLYVERVKRDGGELHCLNSWGDKNNPSPIIPTQRVTDNHIFSMELLPALSPDDIRVGEEVQEDTGIYSPSVSYLAQLSLLARHDKIDIYEWLDLSGDFTSVEHSGLAVLVSKAWWLNLLPGTELSDNQWQAIARQATSNYWRVEKLWIACDIPDYDTMAMIITRTEWVGIRRFSPHLVAAIARAITSCEEDKLRCREIELHMENKESVGRDLSRETGWTLTQDSVGITLQRAIP